MQEDRDKKTSTKSCGDGKIHQIQLLNARHTQCLNTKIRKYQRGAYANPKRATISSNMKINTCDEYSGVIVI